ncbi:hypothetical protein DPMN_060552 [Dreissena polymorpha]|uniref:Uncharacterized protein n=1 Tax=Dreissena polymorpha TaxID=45954 RepID=A0A9D4HIB7_DREPO|nr:hypothetical protein DPMN_060552 [Dreissena polymorpha]
MIHKNLPVWAAASCESVMAPRTDLNSDVSEDNTRAALGWLPDTAEIEGDDKSDDASSSTVSSEATSFLFSENCKYKMYSK